jgi:hypothetical protein
VKNEVLPEPEPIVEIDIPISEPQNVIQEIPQEDEDKKKINDETKIDDDYKVLSYRKRNG